MSIFTTTLPSSLDANDRMPPGTYPMKITNAALQTNDKGVDSIALHLVVISGDHQGARVRDWLNDTHGAHPRIQTFLRALGEPYEGPVKVNLDGLVGRRLLVTVRHETRHGAGGADGPRVRVAFAGYESIGESVRASTGADELGGSPDDDEDLPF